MHVPIALIVLVALQIVPHFISAQEDPIEESTQQQTDTSAASVDPANTPLHEGADTPSAPAEETPQKNIATPTKDIPDTPTATEDRNTSTTTETSENLNNQTNTNTSDTAQQEEQKNTAITESAQTKDSSTTLEEKSSSIPEQPEPIQDEKITIPEKEDEKPVGIDTVSLENPQGNWLFKKIWWERAEERYEKIRTLVDTIWQSRTDFFVKRNNLEKNVLEPFYITVGMDRAELQTILSDLTELFEKQREQNENFSENDRMLYDTIASEEESLKQLERDVETIVNLDHHIDNALETLMEQINRVRDFERQAWKNFKEIAHTLNDAKARELYYMTEGAARNIKNISMYLERDFTHYFNRLINDTTKHISRVQNQIEALKEKGINLKRQSSDESSRQTDSKESEDEDENTDTKPTPKKVGWFGWVTNGITSVLHSVWLVIRMPYDMIFGK